MENTNDAQQTGMTEQADANDGWITDTFNAEDERTAAIIEQERQREHDIADDNEDAEPVVREDTARTPNTIAHYGGDSVRLTLRMPAKNKDQLQYYAARENLSMSEYMLRALENQVARDNGDFDGETILTSRFNIIVDEMTGLKYAVSNLENTVSALVRMMSALTTGDTDLLDIDDEDGEL